MYDPAVRAIVLVGGQGTRLRPLTWRTPKQLVPMLNRPLLELMLEHLHDHGVRRVTFAMTEPNAAIEEAFGDGSAFGMQIERVYEGEPLGSGGAIATCADGWDEPFLVCNGDILSDIDLSGMIAAHRARGAEVSIALYEVEDPSRFGVVALDGERITKFVEKPRLEDAPSRWINAGVWFFEPGAAAELSPERFNRVEDELFPRMAESGRPILGFRHHGYWADVGNSVAYLHTNVDLLRGAVPERLPDDWPESGQAFAAAEVGAAAAIHGPALLATGTVVADGALLEDGVIAGEHCGIEAGAHVAASVLWDRVHIGEGARVTRSVLASGTKVGPGAVLEAVVLGHDAEVGAGEQPPPGTELEPAASYLDGAIVAPPNHVGSA